MSIVEAIVLGAVQGLTEFLPISSSGHLVIIPALIGWKEPAVAFDVMLHVGSLVALLVYFRREFLQALDGLSRPGPARKFIGLLVVGTLPAALVGYEFEEQISKYFKNPAAVAHFLIVTGVILFVGELIAQRRGSTEETPSEFTVVERIGMEVSWRQAVAVGLAQAFAILPGISRSGSTISTGLASGLNRPQAARFSFMLAVPILIGSAVAEAPKALTLSIGKGPLLIGVLTAFVFSYLAIAGMIGYLQRRGLIPFAAYCVVFGVIMSFFHFHS